MLPCSCRAAAGVGPSDAILHPSLNTDEHRAWSTLRLRLPRTLASRTRICQSASDHLEASSKALFLMIGSLDAVRCRKLQRYCAPKFLEIEKGRNVSCRVR